MNGNAPAEHRWYEGITRYHWLVLAIASAGWVFDVFEGQLFTIYKTPAMAQVLNVSEKDPQVDRYSNIAFASFLVGGALGGLVFGVLADKVGRRRAMVLSIFTYSFFTALHYFATTWWHIVGLRFLVAMGVGGEWAVAAALVAEVFPVRARAMGGGIFHATSILGAGLAAVIGIILPAATDWRTAFLIGVAPALLIVWVLVSLRESAVWESARAASGTRPEGPAGGTIPRPGGESAPAEIAGPAEKMGDIWELLGDVRWRGRALVGLGLAAVGLSTYWGIYAWGPELVREVMGDEVSAAEQRSAASFAYLVMNFTGGLAGLLAFAPLSMWTNRRIAFAVYHVGALITVPITFLATRTYDQALVLLPIMGFFVVGMHAGYAVYFPELFPTRLRATGASFCFNVGRLGAAAMLLIRGQLPATMELRYAATLMSGLFLVGLVLLLLLPETKDRQLD